VLKVIGNNIPVFNWFNNEWVLLTVIDPDTGLVYRLNKGKFENYIPLKKLLDTVEDLDKLIESHDRNFPVYLIKK
jgi:hypothetical protein